MPKGQRESYKKCSRAEKALRIEETSNFLIENGDATWKEKTDWICSKFGVGKDCANRYLKDADKLLDEVILDNLGAEKHKRVNSLKKLLKKAQDVDDIRLELQIQQEIAKVQGLHNFKQEIKVEGEVPIFSINPIQASEEEGEG